MSVTHTQPHEKAGQTVHVDTVLDSGPYKGEAVLEDWWDRIAGESWMDSNGNPAALIYALRSAMHGLPIDNEVVYVKINSMGNLLHVSELRD